MTNRGAMFARSDLGYHSDEAVVAKTIIYDPSLKPTEIDHGRVIAPPGPPQVDNVEKGMIVLRYLGERDSPNIGTSPVYVTNFNGIPLSEDDDNESKFVFEGIARASLMTLGADPAQKELGVQVSGGTSILNNSGTRIEAGQLIKWKIPDSVSDRQTSYGALSPCLPEIEVVDTTGLHGLLSKHIPDLVTHCDLFKYNFLLPGSSELVDQVDTWRTSLKMSIATMLVKSFLQLYSKGIIDINYTGLSSSTQGTEVDTSLDAINAYLNGIKTLKLNEFVTYDITTAKQNGQTILKASKTTGTAKLERLKKATEFIGTLTGLNSMYTEEPGVESNILSDVIASLFSQYIPQSSHNGLNHATVEEMLNVSTDNPQTSAIASIVAACDYSSEPTTIAATLAQERNKAFARVVQTAENGTPMKIVLLC
jgi:hypothetical protein